GLAFGYVPIGLDQLLAFIHPPTTASELRFHSVNSDRLEGCSPNETLWNFRSSAEPHCGLILAARMTFAHFAVSSATNFVKAAGELANGVPPSSANRSLIFGSASAAFISVFSLSMMSEDVFFGAAKPYQLLST